MQLDAREDDHFIEAPIDIAEAYVYALSKTSNLPHVQENIRQDHQYRPGCQSCSEELGMAHPYPIVFRRLVFSDNSC
jgi:hypothetical protein